MNFIIKRIGLVNKLVLELVVFFTGGQAINPGVDIHDVTGLSGDLPVNSLDFRVIFQHLRLQIVHFLIHSLSMKSSFWSTLILVMFGFILHSGPRGLLIT